MSEYCTIFTQKGLETVVEAIAENKKVNIVSMVAGDGDGAYYKPTSDMTAIKNEVWRGAISEVSTSGNQFSVSALIPSDEGGFTVRELALLDDAENTITISNMASMEKTTISDGVIAEMLLTVQIVLTNADVIEFLVDGTVIGATMQDILEHNQSDSAHSELFAERMQLRVSETRPTELGLFLWIDQCPDGYQYPTEETQTSSISEMIEPINEQTEISSTQEQPCTESTPSLFTFKKMKKGCEEDKN